LAAKWADVQRQKKEAERAQYAKFAERAEAAKREREERMELERTERERAVRERNARIAAYQDSVDLSRPGGVLRQPTNGVTREMLQNSRKTTSPALVAEERVKEAVSEVGSMPAAEAVALLEQRIGEARAAGVRDYSPTLKKALALCGTLAAAGGSSDSAGKAASETTDPQKAAFDALFGGGYAPPGELDL